MSDKKYSTRFNHAASEGTKFIMIPLLNSFRHGSFDFRLLKRVGDSALFAKTRADITKPHYEVVTVQRRAERTWPDGRVTLAHEAMPSSEQWGVAGWSYQDLGSAERRFSRLVEARENAPQMPAHSPNQALSGSSCGVGSREHKPSPIAGG